MFGKIQLFRNHGKMVIVINFSIFLAVMVHGWLFRVETGFIEEVSLDETIPEEMSKIFNLKFKKELFETDSPLGSPKSRNHTHTKNY